MFDGQDKTSSQLGRSIGEWGKAEYADPAFMVLSGGLLADGEEIVNGIIDGVGRQAPLFGGMAGDDLRMKETYVFNSSHVVSNGAASLVFDQSVLGLCGLAASGWKGIGTAKTVTRSQGNIVFEIDHEPTLEVYKQYLDLEDHASTTAEYPLLVVRDDGSHVLRAAMAINEDKSITYGGTVHEGAKVRFSMPPGQEIIDHAIEQISNFNEGIIGPGAVVLFSCKARHMALGPLVEDELSVIRELWNVPLAGLFTYGEMGPNRDGRCDFHNNTLVPVLIRQK
jgi:hypothetical protein